MRLFDNAEYTKNRNLYVKTPDDGALANLRESYKMLFGLSLRTIVPINTKYRLTHRPNLMMHLDKFKNKYPRIKDIVSCILDGYINNPPHYTLPYSGSDRRKNYVRLCHDCRKEDRELKVLTRNKFSDIRLARIIINMYLYDVYLRALPYHLCDELYKELITMNPKVSKYYYKASDGAIWNLKNRSKTFNIAKNFGLNVAEYLFIYRITHNKRTY